MSAIVQVKTTDGTVIDYIDEPIALNSVATTYFTKDKSDVVVLYKEKQDATALDRLENIVGKYNPCNDPVHGEYWRNLFCWPTKVISEGNMGIVLPAYPKHFFFEAGPMKGKEKEGKWFASAKLRKIIDPSEKGDWLNYFKICIKISRAVAKMHSSGLAHSDLSYKNVLIDPKNGRAAIIDIDGLVVPGRYPPDVIGTPDFIAPEVYQTLHLDLKDPKRCLPDRKTDLYALSVLIYMYLLYRHPLRGRKVHDLDPGKDEELLLGKKALFIEHPTDKSNHPQKNEPTFLPWTDVEKIPYLITGPYIKKLIEGAFITGLHNPGKRPLAFDWEYGLIKTIDLMYPCGNPQCEQKWFVFDEPSISKCPFCDWEVKSSIPVIKFYSPIAFKQFVPDNHKLTVYNDLYLYPWHIDTKLFPDEKLSAENKKPVGYFSFHKNKWILVNQDINDMIDLTNNKNISVNTAVELKDGKQIYISRGNSEKIFIVRMIG